jgi:fumarate reductase subunit D
MTNNNFFKNKRKRALFFANIFLIIFITFHLFQMDSNDEELMTFILFLVGDIILLIYQIVSIFKGKK